MTAGATLLAFGTGHTRLFGLGIAVTSIGLVVQVFSGPRYVRLIRDEQRSRERAIERAASLQNILSAGVTALMAEINVDFSEARVSVYRHKDNHFILLARLSDSLTLRAIGRDRYPDSEGLIGKAWANREAVVVDLPDDRAEWELKCATDYDMDAAQLPGLKMQSKSLAARRIDGHGQPLPHVGLLAIESLRKRGVNGSTLDAIRASSVYPLLEQILIEAVTCLDEQDVDTFRSLSNT